MSTRITYDLPGFTKEEMTRATNGQMSPHEALRILQRGVEKRSTYDAWRESPEYRRQERNLFLIRAVVLSTIVAVCYSVGSLF